MANAEAAFDFVQVLEGGGQAHRNEGDPGGLTNWGFSQRSYPGEDIAGMTRDRAFTLFRRDFWTPLQLEEVDSQRVANEIVEMAFNTTAPGRSCGPAVKAAQQAANAVFNTGIPLQPITEDGCMGPQTVQALNDVKRVGGVGVLAWLGEFNRRQGLYYRRLRPSLVDRFFVGWSRRFL